MSTSGVTTAGGGAQNSAAQTNAINAANGNTNTSSGTLTTGNTANGTVNAAAIRANATAQSQLQQAYGLQFATNNNGAFTISNIAAGGPAAQAGLMAGDQITGVNGRDVSSFSSLTRALRQSPNGRAQVTIDHDGQSETILMSAVRREKC